MAVYRPRGGKARSRYQPEYTNRRVERVRRRPPDDFDPAKMRILMLSRTPVAGVPFILKDIINKYSPHECKTLTGGVGYRDGRRWGPPDALFSQTGTATQLLDWANVVMIHNGHALNRGTSSVKGKRVLCYYHSEPHRVDRLLERSGAPAYVIAQGHSLLYTGLPILPNIIDPAHPLMQPEPNRPTDGAITVAFSPSNHHAQADMVRRKMPYSAKGWPEMQPAFKTLKARGLTVNVHEGVAFDKLMPLRRKAHVLIDEVVTGSYHRCSLEACCHGQVVVNGLNADVRKLVTRITGNNSLPWIISDPKRLADDILAATADYARLQEHMARSRQWIVDNWDPQRLLDEWYIPAFRQAKVV